MRLLVLLLCGVTVAGCSGIETRPYPWALETFPEYQAKPHYRAFALTPGRRNDAGAWGYMDNAPDARTAIKIAKEECNVGKLKHNLDVGCRIYAIGDYLVFDMDAEEREAVIALYESEMSAAHATPPPGVQPAAAGDEPTAIEFPEAWHLDTVGKYEGTVVSSGQKYKIETVFSSDGRGAIQGNYVFFEGGGKVTGRFSDVRPGRDGSMTFSWRDKYGTGIAIIQFSESLREFEGSWGIGDTVEPSNLWNGKLQRPIASTETIDSALADRLLELRKLYEQGQITEEEYEATRRRILKEL